MALEEIRAAAAKPADQMISGSSVDVSQYDQVTRAVKELNEAGRTPDYLFNFAGVARPGYFHELPLQVFRDTMEINFFGTLHTCKAVAPLMMARGNGHIINTSSVAGLLGVFGYTAYGASKWAIRGFTDVLRSELKPHGVKVSILFPPDTDTPQLWEENKTKPPETKALSGNVKVVSPDDVAGVLLRNVERGPLHHHPRRREQTVVCPGRAPGRQDASDLRPDHSKRPAGQRRRAGHQSRYIERTMSAERG